jgi:hypothetical protein
MQHFVAIRSLVGLAAAVLIAGCGGGGGSGGGGGTPAIALSSPQPLWGPVTISITGGVTYASVDYYIDSVKIGSSTQGPS